MNVNQDETKRAAQEGDLPPLPFSPYLLYEWSSPVERVTRTMYTADQMREYARLALAAAGGGVPQGTLTSDEIWASNSIMEVNGSQTPLLMNEIVRLVQTGIEVYKAKLASSPQPEAAQIIEWTDKDGVKHRITINGARELLHKFYDEWPGGWSEVEAEQRSRAEVAPAVAQVPDGWKVIHVESKTWGEFIDAMDRAERKGYLPDAVVDEWLAFDYNDPAAAPEAPAVAQVPQECPSCSGMGGHEKALSSTTYTWVKCADCGGTGKLAAAPEAPAAGEVERWKGLVKQARDALSVYQGFVDDAHILEGQWHWIDDAKATIDAIDAALSEQP